MIEFKYSFVIPYFRRPNHLWNTLLSYKHWYGDRDDFEVIIVVDRAAFDNAGEKEEFFDVVNTFGLTIPIHSFLSPGSKAHNPDRARNFGARIARGDVLCLTSPEIVHRANILDMLDNGPVDHYVMCACEAAWDKKRDNISPERYGAYNQMEFVHKCWYQHSLHNNRLLHFCSFIPRNVYFAIGGFDETYEQWIGYDDDDFREKVKSAGIRIDVRDDMHTIHVEHDRHLPQNCDAQLELARRYYEAKWYR